MKQHEIPFCAFCLNACERGQHRNPPHCPAAAATELQIDEPCEAVGRLARGWQDSAGAGLGEVRG